MEPSTDPSSPPPGMVCQVCGTTMDRDEVVYCTRCGTPHHGECWDYAGRCTTFGCHGSASTHQPPPPQPDAPLVIADGALEGSGPAERGPVDASAPPLPGFAEVAGWLGTAARRLVGLLKPRDLFVFQTRLPVEAAVAALRLRTEPRRLFRFPFFSRHRCFEGTVSDTDFDVQRVVGYGNSYRPRLTGRFVPLAKGTGVSVRVELSPWVKGFLVFWFSGVGLFFVNALVNAAKGSRFGWLMMAHSATMIVMGVVLTLPAFWFEVWRARVALAETFADGPGDRSSGLTVESSPRVDELRASEPW